MQIYLAGVASLLAFECARWLGFFGKANYSWCNEVITSLNAEIYARPLKIERHVFRIF